MNVKKNIYRMKWTMGFQSIESFIHRIIKFNLVCSNLNTYWILNKYQGHYKLRYWKNKIGSMPVNYFKNN